MLWGAKKCVQKRQNGEVPRRHWLSCFSCDGSHALSVIPKYFMAETVPQLGKIWEIGKMCYEYR